MRLIDADALKESLKELEAESNSIRYTQGLQDAIDYYFPQIIDDAPTIEAEPVKHGHWYDKGSLSCRCSECGCKSPNESKFCCNCGAEMDGGADE